MLVTLTFRLATSRISQHLELGQLLEGRHLLERGAYFNVGTQKVSAYKGPVRI